MSPAIVRIVLRYLAAMLVTYGMLAPDEASVLIDDPQLVADAAAVLGMVIAASVEAFYWAARKFGWRT